MKTKLFVDWKIWLFGFSYGKLGGLSTKYFGINFGPICWLLEWHQDAMQSKIEGLPRMTK